MSADKLDDIPRYAGLPLEECERPDWYKTPDGFDFVDEFDFPDSGLFSITLVREASTGRLHADIRHGEDWQHSLRLPLAVRADVPSFGVLARILAEEVSR